MKLRLKEKPVEWVKFTAVMAVLVLALGYLLFRKGLVGRDGFVGLAASALVIVVISAVQPRWFRGFYRLGMTASWHVGQVIGGMLLMIFFLFVVTPMGLLLRLFGKDLLALRRNRSDSYWKAAPPPSPFDRLF